MVVVVMTVPYVEMSVEMSGDDSNGGGDEWR